MFYIGNCQKCGKKFGVLETKFLIMENKNSSISVCKGCKEAFDKKEAVREEKEEKKELEKVLKKNSQFEYVMHTFKLGIGGFFNEEKAQEELDEYGAEGWELVSVTTVNMNVAFTAVPVTKQVIWTFKRKI
jgi:hypothetical protein